MIKKNRCLQNQHRVLRQMPRIPRPESGEADAGNFRNFSSEQCQMLFSGTRDDIIIQLPEPFCQCDHPGRMAQTPFKRTDKYVSLVFHFQPETCVAIPSSLTMAAIFFSSVKGTFSSFPPSGVSLETV